VLAGLFVLIALVSHASMLYADEYYLCRERDMGVQTPLVVKYKNGTPDEILFKYLNIDSDSYKINERDELHYQADQLSPPAPDAFGSLIIDRVTGEMRVIGRIPMAAVQLLVNTCNGIISEDDCSDRMNRIKGGFLPFCFQDGIFKVPFPNCDTWRRGDNTYSFSTYECHRAERQFE